MRQIFLNTMLSICTLSIIVLFAKTNYAQSYSTVPYSTGFESGTLDASWLTSVTPGPGTVSVLLTNTVSWNGLTALSNSGSYYLGMPVGSSAGAVNICQADLYLNLSGQSNLDLNFFWADFNDETDVEDGIYISDDDGVTFTKVIDFYPGDSTDMTYSYYNVSLDSIHAIYNLSYTSTYIVRFQERDNFFIGGGDGFMFDDIEVVNVICNPTAASISPIACNSYTVPSGDETYTLSGTYSDTIPNIQGCDSVITINLQVNNNTVSSINETACDTYLAPDGASYSSSGIYTAVIPNTAGCDSTITIDLIVNNSSTSSIVETACDTYVAPDGTQYNSSGIYTAVIPNASNCDSTITIDLTVNTTTTSLITETVCDSYTAPDGALYSVSGVYTATIPNASNCDSTITIDLTVNNSSSSSIVETACDTYLAPDGASYTSSGTYTAIIPTAAGCDSTITIDLTVNNSSTSSIVETECDLYTAPDGAQYNSSGVYTAIIPTAEGCDSTITIDLTINATTTSTIDTIAIGSYTAPSGVVYTTSGTVVDTISNAAGCDSLITINLTVSSIGITELGSEYFAVYPNPASDFIRLDVKNEAVEVEKIQIYDMSGKLIRTFEDINAVMDVSDLSDGAFMLMIFHSKGMEQVLFSKK